MPKDNPPPDPLLCDFELPLQAVFYPYGFAVRIATNSEEVLRAAEESWQPFRQEFSDPPAELYFAVDEQGPQQCPPDPIFRGRRNLVTFIADPANFATCDLAQGFAFAWLSPGAVKNRAYLRYHFLESAASILMESLHLTPVHAACVVRDGHGVLLCGDSGTGKSSLAFACALRGWTLVTDDGSSLVRNRSERIVLGNPYQMRFREDAPNLFPELRQHTCLPRLNGEMAIELATVTFPEIRTATQAPVDYIVFLDRKTSAPPSLVRFPQKKALRWFEQVITFGDHRKAQRASLRRLLTADMFQLRYSDLDSAVRTLEGMVCDTSDSQVDLASPCDERNHA